MPHLRGCLVSVLQPLVREAWKHPAKARGVSVFVDEHNTVWVRRGGLVSVARVDEAEFVARGSRAFVEHLDALIFQMIQQVERECVDVWPLEDA